MLTTRVVIKDRAAIQVLPNMTLLWESGSAAHHSEAIYANANGELCVVSNRVFVEAVFADAVRDMAAQIKELATEIKESTAAEEIARRSAAEAAGIQDPNDTTACMQDFVDMIIRGREKLAAIRSELRANCTDPSRADSYDEPITVIRKLRRMLGIA